MGGRGASSGVSNKGKKYGTEYTTLLQSGNIKFVRYNDAGSAKSPMETMTKGRVYVTVNHKNELKSITLYDDDGKRIKQVDLRGTAHMINGEKVLPHSHVGYEHDEKGTKKLTKKENALIAKVNKIWENKGG
ncbi:hypothetical protein [Dielma fastidiosa]|uniref:hypothetical protein n=1 Tax=Dielma fastidiosa TaxID=1034346 RepID=UPI000E51FFA4|nr:hypothetical protein [Dielma fastidiosa]RHN01489.1 hypothetical protein DWZ33_05710 [Dielma fastidiosa]